MKSSRKIRIGIGGWNFPPWRGVFYPKGLAQSKELSYAASHLTAIEINSTYYGSQKPESFRKWASEAPEGFKFSVKASRFCTNRACWPRAQIPSSASSIPGDRARRPPRPLLWQFAPTKKFDEADFRTFLELLPEKQDGLALRHVVEVRHDSFRAPAFIALLRAFNVAVVCAEHETYPGFADLTSDFVYLRLQKGKDTIATGYPPKALDVWAERLQTFASGTVPKDLDQVEPKSAPKPKPRLFAYVIHEGKVRAPAAAAEFDRAAES